MVRFEIPFEPNPMTGWAVIASDDGRQSFPTRQAAVAFAMKEARSRAASGFAEAYVSIEGGDGRWRLFDPSFMPVLAG